MTERTDLIQRAEAHTARILQQEAALAARADQRKIMTEEHLAACETFDAETAALTTRLNELRSDAKIVQDVAAKLDEIIAAEVAKVTPIEPEPIEK
jgi:septal ring factor EnvC (AmiA/AmiB activator)